MMLSKQLLFERTVFFGGKISAGERVIYKDTFGYIPTIYGIAIWRKADRFFHYIIFKIDNVFSTAIRIGNDAFVLSICKYGNK